MKLDEEVSSSRSWIFPSMIEGREEVVATKSDSKFREELDLDVGKDILRRDTS